ncbi:DUF2798 domain-containing protein [Pseudomarimonas arenosa]|uniref:DUF2798 domain-containing protein n=1 Tax=Pseudomarimonas arenosa TaxID=2774145 RepID=A0AAW3ZUF6_9GAMM|nr:DUF2798 domain-containing protein [Pseudomarimonas arenosa]MBD8527947.1 DUF2798 domain-containing protein [Pseudomarimonas arenosa]
MIAKKYAPMLFALLLSGLMSLLVSGISTYRIDLGLSEFAAVWTGAWVSAWLIAFPAVLLVSPLVRRLVDRLTTAD